MAHPLQTYLSRTFLELGDGFHFSAPPPDDVAEDRLLGSGDPWDVLACILARLQRGQFEAADSLPDLMKRVDDAGVWNACATLAGFAGRRRLLEGHGIEVGGGLGPLAGKIWRIGLMGENARQASVDPFLDPQFARFDGAAMHRRHSRQRRDGGRHPGTPSDDHRPGSRRIDPPPSIISAPPECSPRKRSRST